LIAQAQPKFVRPPDAAQQQQVFLRAVVGSIVLCAAFGGHSAVEAQEPSPRELERTRLYSISFDPRPFRELLAKAARLRADGLLNFSDTFEISIEADRNADRSLKGVSVVSEASRNDRRRGLAQEFVGAISDSRALAALDGTHHLSMKLRPTQEGVLASATFEVESLQRAQELATDYELLLRAARLQRQGRNESAVLNNMTISANGKQLVMKLDMSREQAGNLLRKHLSLP